MERHTLGEDTELEEYIVDIGGEEQILTHPPLPIHSRDGPFHDACKFENLNLLDMFLSRLSQPPKMDESLVRIVCNVPSVWIHGDDTDRH